MNLPFLLVISILCLTKWHWFVGIEIQSKIAQINENKWIIWIYCLATDFPNLWFNCSLRAKTRIKAEENKKKVFRKKWKKLAGRQKQLKPQIKIFCFPEFFFNIRNTKWNYCQPTKINFFGGVCHLLAITHNIICRICSRDYLVFLGSLLLVFSIRQSIFTLA